MTHSSLLGSWIDVAAATAAAETLCDQAPENSLAAPPPATSITPSIKTMPTSVSSSVSSSVLTAGALSPGVPRVFSGAKVSDRFGAGAGMPGPAVGDGEVLEMEPDDAPSPPPPRLHGRLRALRVRAERNGLVSAATATPSGRSAFAVPLGSLPVRVRALADWMNECFEPASLFVADDDGQALVEFRGGAALLAAATVLAEAAAKARRHLPGAAGAAVVHLTLGPAQVLSLVTSVTALGRWHAGLTMSVPLAEDAALELAQSLQAAAAGA